MTPKDYLAVIPPACDPVLLAENETRSFFPIGEAMSSVPCREHIFECELHRSPPVGDYSICMEQAAAEAFLSEASSGTMAEWLRESAGFRAAQGFISKWARDDTLRRNVNCFWMEFDRSQMEQNPPEPCLFFDAASVGPKADNGWALDAVETILGRPVADELKARLYACIEALPADASLFQLGAMHSRRSNDLTARLFTGSLPPEKAIDYLDKIGWDGDQNPLAEFLSWAADFWDGTCILDFDVSGSGISSKIGVNISAHGENKPKLKQWLTALEERNLAMAEKIQGIDRWLAPQPNLEPLRPGVSHMKIPWNDRPLGAKIYLWHREPPAIIQNLNRW